MKRIIVLSFLAVVFSFVSCKKCAECTFVETDGSITGPEEFCESGHVYDNQLLTYESSGWNCKEK